MNEYHKIINEINSGLTGNFEQDHSYLLEQSKKYKNHLMGNEILKEIARKLYEISTKSYKCKFSKNIDEGSKVLNKKLNDANNYVLQRNYESAKKLLNEYLKCTLNIYKEDQITRYFTFKDIIEFYCSKEKLNIQKKTVWVDLRTDEAYKLLAYIASEEKNFDEAIEYLEKGLYFNPMNIGIRFEFAESYKMQNNLEKMYESIKNIYDYIYDPSMLSRYYRLLGYYFIEKQNYDLAYSLYAISIYYEDSKIAQYEINYIKQQTGNPNFEKTTSEILNILKQHNIPTTISQSNLNQLKNLSIEKQVIEKQPSLIQYLNKIIGILTNPINDSTKINILKITTPKITAEEIFDDNKIIFDAEDKKRIEKNIGVLKEKNIPFIEHMKTIPFNSCTNLRSKEEIINRVLADYAIATCALYSVEGKSNIIPSVINQMDEKLNIKSVLLPIDANFLNAISEQKISKQKLQDATWMFEECAMLMWTLNLIDKPNSDKECNVEQLDNFFFNIKSYDELLEKCTLKSKEEILEQSDLLFRYHWACRETRMQGQQLPQLNEMIVQEQCRALEWVLNWKIEKLMKDKINVKYEKDNFNFNFNISTQLHISNITNFLDYNLLFSLSDSLGRRIISMSDAGPESDCPIDTYFEEEIRRIKSDGWNIIHTGSLLSQNIKGGIKKLVINKEILPDKDEKVGVIIYYFVLNGHIIVLETILEDGLDYSDNSNIQNSRYNLLTINMLFSIKENNTEIIDDSIFLTRMMNYRVHAQNLDIPLLNDFMIEDVENPQIVFLATNNGFRELITSDGPMNANETFEQRISLVVKNTIDFMKTQSIHNNENSLFYYKDYSNKFFNYKIYVQDYIISDENINKVIRQFNVYFIEPMFNDFYQLTISSPPIIMPLNTLKLGVVDTDNDQITDTLEKLTKEVMDNLKYKNINSNSNTTIDSINYEEEITPEEYINNEFDYSNRIPTVETITNLVKYCDETFKHFITLVIEDEIRNEPLKYELKNYVYKKLYKDTFNIYIKQKNDNSLITCTDFTSFQSAVNNGKLQNVSSVEIKINMGFRRGKPNNLKKHDNLFTITFKPSRITFNRKSNYDDSQMNKIESEIKEILNKFQIANTIFCTK